LEPYGASTKFSIGIMKRIILPILILIRLLTNDWMMLENRSPKPKLQPPEVLRFIRRPAKKGRKVTPIT
jgi:hypothetical protein